MIGKHSREMDQRVFILSRRRRFPVRLFSRALLIVALAAACSAGSQLVSQTNELSSLTLEDFGKTDSDHLTVYGVRIGMSLEEAKRVLGTQNLNLEEDFGTWGIAHKNGQFAGVAVDLADHKVVEISFWVKTWEQRNVILSEYAARSSGNLRAFFESYSDEVRLKVWGPTERLVLGDGPGSAEYDYKYPDRGVRLNVLQNKAPVPRLNLYEISLFPVSHQKEIAQ